MSVIQILTQLVKRNGKLHCRAARTCHLLAHTCHLGLSVPRGRPAREKQHTVFEPRRRSVGHPPALQHACAVCIRPCCSGGRRPCQGSSTRRLLQTRCGRLRPCETAGGADDEAAGAAGGEYVRGVELAATWSDESFMHLVRPQREGPMRLCLRGMRQRGVRTAQACENMTGAQPHTQAK